MIDPEDNRLTQRGTGRARIRFSTRLGLILAAVGRIYTTIRVLARQ